MEWAHQKDIDLIIALDCGIKGGDKVEKACEYGIDFIIADHHTPGPSLPPAHAVLDPKRADCSYPYPFLSGCGIGLKILQGLLQHTGRSIQKLRSYLDLVAVSTASDIVPMTGENRVLTQLGLKVLNNNPRPGLKALANLTGLLQKDIDKSTGEVKQRRITVADVVFKIGPRLNAAGRMDDACHAVRALIASSDAEAYQHAEQLNKRNNKRRQYDSRTTEEAVELIKQHAQQERHSTVLFNPQWHKGVLGIAASRLIEKHYYRPTILFTASNGKVAGSARSVPGFDLYKALEHCSELLEQFGGHKQAAGLTLTKENVTPFIDRFEKIVQQQITKDQLTPKLYIDATLNFSDITPSFFTILRQLGPFGPGNMRPVFLTKNVKDTGQSRIVGDNHLKLALRQKDSSPMWGIAFEQGKYADQVKTQQPFDICYTIKENYWKGRTSIELYAKDFRF